MSEGRKRVEVTDPYFLTYDGWRELAKQVRGWIRSSSKDGDTAEVWGDDEGTIVYTFSGRAYARWWEAIASVSEDRADAARGALEYVAKTKNLPPSVYIRDALVKRAEEALDA